MSSQPGPLRVETTFPAHSGDPLLPLAEASTVVLQQIRCPSLGRNSAEWVVNFESKSGAHEWRVVDAARHCAWFRPAFELTLVDAPDGRCLFTAQQAGALACHAQIGLTVHDQSGERLGVVRPSENIANPPIIVNGSGDELIEILEQRKSWLNSEHVYQFTFRDGKQAAASAERRVLKTGVLKDRPMFLLQFGMVPSQMDPIHKLLCICALLFHQKEKFRSQQVNVDTSSCWRDLKIFLDTYFCCGLYNSRASVETRV